MTDFLLLFERKDINMSKEFFETEKEAKDFIENNCIDCQLVKTIANLKNNGYIKQSIIEKAEEEFIAYKNESRNLSKRKDLIEYLVEDSQIIFTLFDAIQYLKDKITELKKDG